MAELFECLLSLLHPLNKMVFTQVPFIFQPELVMLIQKPGTLIASIDEGLWHSHGK
jgi:hypothetical protein